MPVLLIQGGAGGTRPVARREAFSEALRQIAEEVWDGLDKGASSLEAVVHAATLLEDNPLFNAGLGSKLQIDGQARLSASLMDGATERFSGVVNVQGLMNPTTLCRHLLDEDCRVLSGDGALIRGQELGLREGDPRTPEAIRIWERGISGKTGTIGAVALDHNGQLAAATSTGGRGMERVGRVSDSCTVAGNIATPYAAVSCTGIGEDIVDGALAVRIESMVQMGMPLNEATQHLKTQMESRDWKAGMVSLDSHGKYTCMHTTEWLYWHVVDNGKHLGFPVGT